MAYLESHYTKIFWNRCLIWLIVYWCHCYTSSLETRFITFERFFNNRIYNNPYLEKLVSLMIKTHVASLLWDYYLILGTDFDGYCKKILDIVEVWKIDFLVNNINNNNNTMQNFICSCVCDNFNAWSISKLHLTS